MILSPQQITQAQAYNASKKAPQYWPKDPGSAAFARVCARFQRRATLGVDGKFGPNTQKAYDEAQAALKPRNYIIADGFRWSVPFPVITWEQEATWASYAGGNFHWRTLEVEALILHWDVTFSSRQTHLGLLKPERDASVHFYMEGDGTIYQGLDAGFVEAWHAGSAGEINERSAGVEMNNRWYKEDNGKHGAKARPLIKDLPVNGNNAVEHQDFFDEQEIAALGLAEALSTIFSFPRQIPKAPLFSSSWAGDDKDPPGSVLRGLLDKDSIYRFSGCAGHFHFAKGKIDPGVKMFDRFKAAGW